MININFGKVTLSLNDMGIIADIKYCDGNSILPAECGDFAFINAGLSGKMYAPISLSADKNLIAFAFENNNTVSIKFDEKSNYTVFTVTECSESIEAVTFGTIPVTVGKIVGDVIGVSRDDKYAVGIQALNAKTLAGYPREFASDARKDLAQAPDISQLSVAPFTYFDSAAFPYNGGSVLQLWCENRNRVRIKDFEGYTDITVPPYTGEDAAIAGASFALFACDVENALDLVGEIEIGEGLPHPIIDGEWGKKQRSAMCSYLISEFNLKNIEKLLGYAEKAGMKYLYNGEVFENWGHFDLRKSDFPNGDDDLVKCSEIAAQRGIKLGIHTLSNFTTTNDPYVTPVPSKSLAKMGVSSLKNDIDSECDFIEITDTPPCFSKVTVLQTIQIDDELITYKTIEGNKLIELVRGAFGTSKADHSAGSIVYKLCDHGYRTFYPDIYLQSEFTKRLGELFRKANLAQISFDGLEGCRYTGEDEYAVNKFCLGLWDEWGRADVINDASRLNHNLWHMHTRMNWGEPWGAKMREGMIEYRIRNQDFYRRNMFPRMLGWFLIRLADRKFEATSPEDIEWALSMAAGFDAGFALCASETVLDGLGNSSELLETIKNWETLRISDAFSADLKKLLLKKETEWHLEKCGDDFKLYQMNISDTYTCDLLELQPGQPGGSDWVYVNPFGEQEFDFRLRVVGDGYIENPTFNTSNGLLKIECTVEKNQYLIMNNGKCFITDKNYNLIKNVAYSGKGILSAGQQGLSFTCEFGGDEAPEVQIKVFTYDTPQIISLH